jgi:hypothetical protein
VILKAIFAPRNSEISFTDTRMTSLYPLPLYKEVMFNPSKEQMFGPTASVEELLTISYFGATEFTSVFCSVRVAQFLVFCVRFG